MSHRRFSCKEIHNLICKGQNPNSRKSIIWILNWVKKIHCMILNIRKDSLTSISIFFFFGVLSRIVCRKRNVEIKLFGQRAMTYYPILKQVWGNYLIIAFIDNQFLTSICLSTGFIRSKNTARQRLASWRRSENRVWQSGRKLTLLNESIWVPVSS